MALVQAGAIITEISGKLGGQTFGNGRQGIYLKNTGNYITNNSIKANAQKNKLVSITSRWKLLTSDQRVGWDELATELPYVDRFGNTRYYSGFSMFTKINYNRMLIEIAFTQDAPSLSEHYPATELEVSGDSGEFTVTLSGGSEDIVIMVAATQGMSQGSNQYKKYLRNIGYNTMQTLESGWDVTDEYNVVFSSPGNNSKVFFSCKMFDKDTGQQIGTELVANLIVIY